MNTTNETTKETTLSTRFQVQHFYQSGSIAEPRWKWMGWSEPLHDIETARAALASHKPNSFSTKVRLVKVQTLIITEVIE